MQLEQVKPYLNYDFSSEQELVKSIEEMSFNFTRNREKINDYLKDPRLCAAYVCFYLLTNMPKLKAALNLIKFNMNELIDFDIYDFGAGPATFSLALLELNKNLEIKAIEKSPVMIKQGESLVRGLFPGSNFEYINTVSKEKKKPRLGIFGHSANEMGESITLDYISRYDLDAILFLEPGTKQSFSILKNLRTGLVKKFNLHYPCLDKSDCPLTLDDWCHQYLQISHDKSVERLTQLVKKDRRHLPMCIHYYNKKEIDESQHKGIKAHITRVYPSTKFSFEWQICYKEKESLIIKDLQIMTRGLKKSKIKELQNILAGDHIEFKILKELEQNKIRGELL